MARLTEDSDYDAGETTGKVPRPRSYSRNDDAYNRLRTRLPQSGGLPLSISQDGFCKPLGQTQPSQAQYQQHQPQHFQRPLVSQQSTINQGTSSSTSTSNEGCCSSSGHNTMTLATGETSGGHCTIHVPSTSMAPIGVGNSTIDSSDLCGLEPGLFTPASQALLPPAPAAPLPPLPPPPHHHHQLTALQQASLFAGSPYDPAYSAIGLHHLTASGNLACLPSPMTQPRGLASAVAAAAAAAAASASAAEVGVASSQPLFAKHPGQLLVPVTGAGGLEGSGPSSTLRGRSGRSGRSEGRGRSEEGLGEAGDTGSLDAFGVDHRGVPGKWLCTWPYLLLVICVLAFLLALGFAVFYAGMLSPGI
ncbi:unnamed protein product [Protopolystoma xenopodis]|uniref:Uncharacterized protein n=1 Tax=Protopolystoma xenopodis TaxID=117903 RepID=A0A3S5AVD2_9PLAT|nr:unnamed protein product [Protopolystoma xenopodis]